jgi:hypothetical protein
MFKLAKFELTSFQIKLTRFNKLLLKNGRSNTQRNNLREGVHGVTGRKGDIGTASMFELCSLGKEEEVNFYVV